MWSYHYAAVVFTNVGDAVLAQHQKLCRKPSHWPTSNIMKLKVMIIFTCHHHRWGVAHLQSGNEVESMVWKNSVSPAEEEFETSRMCYNDSLIPLLRVVGGRVLQSLSLPGWRNWPWEHLPHSSYCPDLALTDICMFGKLTTCLRGPWFPSGDTLKTRI